MKSDKPTEFIYDSIINEEKFNLDIEGSSKKNYKSIFSVIMNTIIKDVENYEKFEHIKRT